MESTPLVCATCSEKIINVDELTNTTDGKNFCDPECYSPYRIAELEAENALVREAISAIAKIEDGKLYLIFVNQDGSANRQLRAMEWQRQLVEQAFATMDGRVGSLRPLFKMLEARAVGAKVVAASVYGPNSNFANGNLLSFTEAGARFECTSYKWGCGPENGEFVISWETLALDEAELIAHFTREKQEADQRRRQAREEAERRCSEEMKRYRRAQYEELKAEFEPEAQS